jgi:hypothetical protein
MPPTIISIPVDTSFAVANTVVNSYSSIIGSGGSITALCTSVGINEISEGDLTSIYPNPAKDYFTIEINTKQKNVPVTFGMEIFNVLGEKIYSVKLNRNHEVINCKDFAPGLYFIAVRMDGPVLTKKLIVSK